MGMVQNRLRSGFKSGETTARKPPGQNAAPDHLHSQSGVSVIHSSFPQGFIEILSRPSDFSWENSSTCPKLSLFPFVQQSPALELHSICGRACSSTANCNSNH